jgi:hypothetical protein
VAVETQEAEAAEAQEATEIVAETDAPEADDTQVTKEDANADLSAVEREREARRKANREAQNLRERLKSFEEAEEQRKQEAMSDLEKAAAARKKIEQEHKELQDSHAKALAELLSLKVNHEATAKALAAGARQDRVEAVLRLADLDDVVDEDGNPDGKAIDAAIKAVLKDYSEFRNGSPNVGAATSPGNEPQAKKSVADMSAEELADYSRRAQWGERITF